MREEVQFRSDKLAVLIDADNTSIKVIESLLREITKFGTAYVKRVYGDWTSNQMSTWKKVLNNFALTPIQQFAYTSGKNSTDIALIIDAMDLLYTDKFDGFCIVSSDSDFTPLVNRIRQNGLFVYGFGRKLTPQSFVSACDRFIYTDLLDESDTEKDQNLDNNTSYANFTSLDNNTLDANLINKDKLKKLLIEAYESVTGGEKIEINMGRLGQQINLMVSSFDSREYGFKKLGDLLRYTDLFVINENNIKLK